MSELPVPLGAKPATMPELPKPETRVCANCHAELAGEYCAACGQRHEPHVHTVAHFAGEAFESISHADSRLWRTLWYLFARPGFLTREFFAGRRVTYLPPFRLYLVLSVLVFLILSLSSDDPSVTQGPLIRGTPEAARAEKAMDDARAAVERSGLPSAIIPDVPVVDASELAAQEDTKPDGLKVQSKGLDEFCNAFDQPEAGGESSVARDNVRQFCDRIKNDNKELFTALVHNLPRAMFLFLPLLAGIMKLLYWRPRRYYVEHLLFLVHNHAAVFLLIILLNLFSLIPWLGDYAGFMVLVAMAYMTWYVYRAMRNVYGQGGLLTFSKYTVLGFTYIVTAFVTLLLTLIFLALFG
jgi:Protein of unknown function (DUF3667)